MVKAYGVFEECVDHIIDHNIIICRVSGITYQKIGKEIEVVFVLCLCCDML